MMTFQRLSVARVVLAACALSVTAACELVETCDPDVDPYCVPTDASDVGADTVACSPSGATRCAGSSVETCVDGTWESEPCSSGACSAGACTAGLMTVRILDQTPSLSGQHPGADIDAIALESGDRTYYATRVTDWFIPNDIENLAPTPSEALGPPDVGPDACDLTTGAEHWISLAGGEIVVTFDRAIRPGDRIIVYECAGAARDSFDVSVGAGERLEDSFTPVLEGATGTVSVQVP